MLTIAYCNVRANGITTVYEDGSRTFQTFPETVYQKEFGQKGARPDYEKDKFTPQQNRQYRIAIYGLAAIPPNELYSLPESEKKEARRTFTRAQAEINRLKNQRLDEIISKTLPAIFTKGNVIKKLAAPCTSEYDKVHNTLDFDSLGITKDMVIDRLVSRGILNPTVFER